METDRDRDKELALRILLKTKPCDAKTMEEAGMVPKSALVDGATYLGFCRNASEAVWHADKRRKKYLVDKGLAHEEYWVGAFTYRRTKFNDTFLEDINHPEDDDGYDLFVPMQRKD